MDERNRKMQIIDIIEKHTKEMLRPHCPTSTQDLDTRADAIMRGES